MVSMAARWMQRLRVAPLTNSVVPLLLGLAIAGAVATESPGWEALRWCLLIGGLHQGIRSFAFGWRGGAAHEGAAGDPEHAPSSPPESELPQMLSALRWMFLVAASLSMAIGAYLGFSRGHALIPLLIAVSIGLAWAVESRPRLCDGALGELVQSSATGLLLPTLGFLLGGGELANFPPVAWIPCFFVAYASQIAAGLPSHSEDLETDRSSYSVRHGQLRARRHLLEILGAAALSSWMVVPGLRTHPWMWLPIAGPTLLLLLSNVPLLGSADAGAHGACRGECKRFVVVAGIAGQLLLLAWSLALVLAR
jgi:1,4-dihydroxy-2-naphthoate octaprenyltransferase